RRTARHCQAPAASAAGGTCNCRMIPSTPNRWCGTVTRRRPRRISPSRSGSGPPMYPQRRMDSPMRILPLPAPRTGTAARTLAGCWPRIPTRPIPMGFGGTSTPRQAARGWIFGPITIPMSPCSKASGTNGSLPASAAAPLCFTGTECWWAAPALPPIMARASGLLWAPGSRPTFSRWARMPRWDTTTIPRAPERPLMAISTRPPCGAACLRRKRSPQPVGGTRYTSDDFMLTCLPADDRGPVTYQWYKDGSLLGGATTRSFLLTNLSTTNSAGNYTVVANDGFGSVTSAPAYLTVLSAAQVTAGMAVYLNFDNNIDAQAGTTVSGTPIGFGGNPEYTTGPIGSAAIFNNDGSSPVGWSSDWAVSLGDIEWIYTNNWSF